MKCKCGTKNKEGSKYCQECGNLLVEKKVYDEKRPLVAAGLNLLIAGLGFVYLKEYPKAILSFIVVLLSAIYGGIVVGLIALFIVVVWSYFETEKYNKHYILGEGVNQIE